MAQNDPWASPTVPIAASSNLLDSSLPMNTTGSAAVNKELENILVAKPAATAQNDPWAAFENPSAQATSNKAQQQDVIGTQRGNVITPEAFLGGLDF